MEEYNTKSMSKAFIKLGIKESFITKEESNLYTFDADLYYQQIEGFY